MTTEHRPDAVRLHADAVIVDGLQINNWSREVLQELRTGGVTGVNATAAVWEGTEPTLRAVADWYQLLRSNDDIAVLAETADDIRKAKEEGRVAVLLGFQNTSPFGDDYRMVEVFHRLGVRIAQLTYNNQNAVGGSCYEPTDSGLTRFGRVVVGEMNRLGMLVDLSHVGNQTSRDAAEASTAPVAITHANPTWFVDNPRNKPDDVMRAVAAGEGVVGCCLYPIVLGGSATTLAEFSSMVARLVDDLGPAHVALGSDCTRNWGEDYVEYLRSGHWRPRGSTVAQWPEWPHWFRGPEDFPRVTEGLVAAGLDETTIRGVLGENWLRLFDDVFAGRSAS